jgi:hypothetical protein
MNNNNEQITELFMQKIDDIHYNYIELIKEGDSLKGFFYGIEVIQSSQVPLYYKTLLNDLKVKGNRVDFTINNFLFSNKPFYGRKEDSFSIIQKPDNIPFSFSFPIKYFGYRNADTLRMNKITMLDDSKSTEVLFVKKL